MQSIKRAGNYILLFTSFIWGMAFAFQSQAGEILGTFTFTAARMTLAAAEVGILCIVRDFHNGEHKKENTPQRSQYKKNTIKGGLCCGSFMGVAIVFQQIGIDHTTAAKAGFITALYIIIVPIIASFLFKKKIIKRIWLAVAIALIGMYLLCMSGGEGFSAGDIYVLICALFFTGQIIFADIYAPKANPTKMAEIQFLLVGSVSWVLAFIFEKPCMDDMMNCLIPILYCGCISGGMGYTLQLVGQKYTDPTSASLCMSFESVFSAIGGAIILHETMSLREVLGCAVMFAAIILVQLPVKNKNNS